MKKITPKKVVKKLLSMVGMSDETYIKSEQWIKDLSVSYLDETKREMDVQIDADFKKRVSYPNQSRAIEKAIDDLVTSKKYTFKKMLVIKNPYQHSPLCAMAVFNTKESVAVKVTVLGKTSDCDISYTLPKTTDHKVPIMGLYAAYTNKIKIELLDCNGNVTKTKLFNLPVEQLKGKNAKTGVKKKISTTDFLYDLTLVYGGGDDGIFPFAFDKNGDKRFCFSLAPKTYGFQPISGGKFLYLNKKIVIHTNTNPSVVEMCEVDQMGRFHNVYYVEKGAHHDFAELEDGNFLVGSNVVEGQTFEDGILEIDRETGDVLLDICLTDYFDPKFINTSDWAHLNTVSINKEEKTVLVCLRNLHTVAKLNYETKEVVWLLAHPLFYEGSSMEDKVLKPDDSVEWFFQPHAAYFMEPKDGNPDKTYVVMYDNHRDKRIPVSFYDNLPYSYARIFEIDEKKGTVSMFKSFQCKQSLIRSNVIYEPDTDRLMVMSGKVKKKKKYAGEVIEFDYNTGEVINLFSVNCGYYRAYEMQFEPEKMIEPMDNEGSYFLGKVRDLEKCEKPDLSALKEIPEKILDPQYETEEIRSRAIREIVADDPEYYVDPEQDIARIKLELMEDYMYFYMVDHLLEHLYFVGSKNTYYRDFTDTVQERPYFMRIDNTEAIDLSKLEEDTYEIYYKHKNGMYNPHKTITIKNK